MEMTTWLVFYVVVSSVFMYLVAVLVHGRKFVYENSARLEGKTVLVTGGSSGIGRATAVNLAERGARVLLCSVDKLKGSVTAQQIRGQTSNAQVVFYELNLADTNSIRELACQVYRNEPRLDVIINNAAIAHHYKKATVDGYETIFGVNYLGHFLLTYLLLDLMKRSGGGRVINVSSVSHTYCMGLDFEVMDKKKSHYLFPNLTGYEVSKLALVVMARELAKRYADDNIVAVSCHPGLVITDLWSSVEYHYGKLVWTLYKLFLKPFWIKAEEACNTLMYCVLTEHIKDVTGKFITAGKPSRENVRASGPEVGDRLWQISLFLTGCSSKLTLKQNLEKRLNPTLTRRTLRDLEWWELGMMRKKETDPNERMEIKRS